MTTQEQLAEAIENADLVRGMIEDIRQPTTRHRARRILRDLYDDLEFWTNKVANLSALERQAS